LKVFEDHKIQDKEESFELKAFYSDRVDAFWKTGGNFTNGGFHLFSIVFLGNVSRQIISALGVLLALSGKVNAFVCSIEVFPLLVGKATVLPDHTARGQVKIQGFQRRLFRVTTRNESQLEGYCLRVD